MSTEITLEEYVNTLVTRHHDKETGATWFNVLGATLHLDHNGYGYYVPTENLAGWHKSDDYVGGYEHAGYTFMPETNIPAQDTVLTQKLHALAYYTLLHDHAPSYSRHSLPATLRNSPYIAPIMEYAEAEQYKHESYREAVANINIHTFTSHLENALATIAPATEAEQESLNLLTNPPTNSMPPVPQKEWLTGEALEELYTEIKEASAKLANLIDRLPTYATIEATTWADHQERYTVHEIIRDVIATEIDSKPHR
jgi:hypothetical protein